ncbi:TPA: hypothetical protein NJ560_004591 [Vibrio parahaemolyticus]|nr:hypothetical protein [Vibrio parahaemolyticus]
MNKEDDFLDFKIKRSLPTYKVNVDDLRFDNTYEIDPLVPKKYQKFCEGKLKLFLTRLRICRITPGFYKPTKSGLVYVYEKPESKDIEIVKTAIRQGHRPLLYLYHSIKPDDDSLLCSDDLIAYNAYLELGISMPPVAIYASKKGIEESCFILRGGIDKAGIYNYVEGFHYHTYKELPLKWREKGEMSPKVFFEESISELNQAREKLALFHVEGQIHYHHTVSAILERVTTSLASIEMLFKEEHYLCAASIVRMMYEVLLNYYIDWLSPDIMPEFLQINSVTSSKERMDGYNIAFKQRVKKGISKTRATKLKDSDLRCDQLASKVIEKAKMLPVDEQFHHRIYSRLSKIAHHSFSVNELHFEKAHGLDSQNYKTLIYEIIGVSDFVVKQTLNMTSGDVGRIKI